MSEIKNKLNSISIKDLFWFQIKEHLISFRFKGLPEELHYTISFNSKSDYDFHITKNTVNTNDKPKISILVIDKELAKSNFESLGISILFKMLKAVDMDKLKQSNELDFISFSQLEKDDCYSENEQYFLNNFKDISKVKQKTRLKVNGKWNERLLNYLTSDGLMNLVNNNISSFNEIIHEDMNGGILLRDGSVIYMIKILEKWYELRTDLKLTELFSETIDKDLLKLIWWKIKRSIVNLKNVNSYKEIEHLNKPIRLVQNE